MIQRDRYMHQIRAFIDKPIVKVITGMRRTGKSALLEMTKQELVRQGIPEVNIFYANFESLRYEKLKDYRALYDAVVKVAEALNGRLYILLDEIQEVSEWERAVNSFRVDLDCDIFITGSNAKLLSGELATHLAGRYVEIRVHPLSFSEYLDFAHANDNRESQSIQDHFADYLRFGGLPGIHQMNWEEPLIMQYLADIYHSVLLKDVIQRNNIRDTALLESIVLFLMDNIGNIFSAKTISDFLKNEGRKLSTETIYNYIKALEDAFLIHKVSRFDIKGKRMLETQEKYFFTDLGFRHSILGYRKNDIGGVLENVVFLELIRRGYDVTIGKLSTTIVDFVANRAENRLYLQVCYVLTEYNMDREFSPLEAIADHYEKMVLSTDSLYSFNRNGIRQKNITEYLVDK